MNIHVNQIDNDIGSDVAVSITFIVDIGLKIKKYFVLFIMLRLYKIT